MSGVITCHSDIRFKEHRRDADESIDDGGILKAPAPPPHWPVHSMMTCILGRRRLLYTSVAVAFVAGCPVSSAFVQSIRQHAASSTTARRSTTPRRLGLLRSRDAQLSSASKNDLSKDQESRLEDILALASAQHTTDVGASLQSGLWSEKDTVSSAEQDSRALPFHWRSTVASVIETSEPVMDDQGRRTILDSASLYWDAKEKERNNSSQDDDDAVSNSRFTLQGPNKRELHAADLPNCSKQVINVALASVYPMLRKAFGAQVLDPDCDADSWSLLLYDALVIEYDATTVKDLLPVSDRPAQPLHRDLGLMSVNIALDDPSGFQGGGTVFEQLLLDSNDDCLQEYTPGSPAVLPRKAGYAVAHPSNERHAGGALISGRRTILVLFVTGTRWTDSTTQHACSKRELAARCKGLGMKVGGGETLAVPTLTSAQPLGSADKVLCYRAAVESDPSDGEAWLYLAMTLMTQSSDSIGERTIAYQEAVECLKRARILNPADGRVHNTLGLALQKQKAVSEKGASDDDILEAFQAASRLHTQAAIAGCKGASMEARSALLNWGLGLANRDDFVGAIAVLRKVCVEGVVADLSDQDLASAHELDPREVEARRIVRDAKGLLRFCKREARKASTVGN